MNAKKPIAITFVALMTAAGSPGPEDAAELNPNDEQYRDLTDGVVPDEAENLRSGRELIVTEDVEVAQIDQVDAAVGGGTGSISGSKAAGSSGESELEVVLSDDYIQGTYFPGGGLLGFDNALGHMSVYFSDERDFVGSVGLMTEPISIFKEGFTLSAGARGYLALLADPNDDVFAAAPGVQGRYALPSFQGRALNVAGSLFYAPNILTLGDATDIIDLDVRLEAEILPEIIGMIGIREFRFDSDEGGDKRAASEIQVGARFAF